MEIPMPWLIVSGIFFAFGIVAFVALIVLVWKLLTVVQELQPKINALMARVEEVSKKVDDISSSVKSTVESVGNKTQSFVSRAESIASESVQFLGKFSGWIMTGMAVLKLVREFNELRQKPAEKSPGTSVDNAPALKP